jgi:Family of unknown function (DUF5995)
MLTLAALVLGLLCGRAPGVAQATDPAPWTSLLPAAPVGRGPDEAAECPGGQPQCVLDVEAALSRQVTELGCDHNAVFARAYLLITRDVAAASQTPGFFADSAYINHFDAAFAAEYGRQSDAHRAGTQTAPAWQIAFDAADREQVSGPGNLYLAVNAHIGRDMPLILARVGLDALRRADQNKINDVLYAGMRPLLNELAANYDSSLGYDAPGTVEDLAFYQYIAALRERAWRLAEELAAAPTNEDRAAIEAHIEAEAEASALALRASFAYPPGGQAAARRDAYCAAHWTAPS